MKNRLFLSILGVFAFWGCKEALKVSDSSVFLVETPAIGCNISNAITGNHSLDAFLDYFCNFNSQTSENEVVACIDSLKTFQGKGYQIIGQLIVKRLNEGDAIYQNRGPLEIVRLRGYLLASLGRLGTPKEAIPYLITELKHNHRQHPYLAAAAARAAGGLSEFQHLLVPDLVKFLNASVVNDVVDLDHYNSWPPQKPTSIKEEVLKTLIRFEEKGKAAIPDLLRAINSASIPNSVYNRNGHLAKLAEQAISSIDPQMVFCNQSNGLEKTIKSDVVFVEKWPNPQERSLPKIFDLMMENHFGEKFMLKEFYGKPIILTFFYSRCDNRNKCSMTISKLAHLQAELEKAGLKQQSSILALSLEPAYDTPQRMKSFAEVRGVKLDQQVQVVKVADRKNQQKLVNALGISVSYNEGQVAMHGIELLLLDKNGKYVRKYTNTHWRVGMVIEDLKRLLDEDGL
ncbi:MAG: hypothetical protein DHS20C18_23580 [Saprospiraceae bacterium]|nr:MAG: hypothetical protein DHS20C18_23580 [Saprospiraceae bacterium]